MGELDYAYYNNRFIKIDTATGTVYRWSIEVTNGEPTIALEEVE